MSEQKEKLTNIKEIEENMNRSQTIGDDEMIEAVWMTYVSPDEIEFLLARIKALEGLLQQFVEQYPCEHEPERFFENPECDYCSLFIEANSQLEEV